ncbi:MAG TPA: asparagine synthase-related protein [Verrucomicrobiae bacterium]|jgi:asparagine synthase (glutamine-hydrolysing)|nr:asparagine synthase-related protein [Verrucomicrobiae bacterium]
MHHYVEDVIDLTDPKLNQIHNMSVEQARQRVLSGAPDEVLGIDGSFALVARDGKTVRLARSMDRPMRYFLAKRHEGPALVVSDRIDRIHEWLKSKGFGSQFHPSYTRMIPAHYIVELQLIGCPDPDPTYTRFFTPERERLSTDLNEIGAAYIGAAAEEVRKWLLSIPADAPVGVCFSGGIDSGAVFLMVHHAMQKLGMNHGRLKAFTLDLGDGPDLAQARDFLRAVGLELFLEPVRVAFDQIDYQEAVRIVEDYKPLDIECAAMGLALFRGIRERYPDWRYVADGDGGDENLKDYPIEENPELTIRSVVHNLMLYQEGWGVGRIKHSLTYSGGLSRSYARTYAPARHFGFEGFSPFTRPAVIEVAEGIPFIELSQYDVDRLYGLKGEIVSRGIRALTGIRMPVFQKRRFQHGAVPEPKLRQKLPDAESVYREAFLGLYQS